MNLPEPEPHLIRQTQASMINLSPAQASRALLRKFGRQLKSTGNPNFERVRYTTYCYDVDSAVVTWTYSILPLTESAVACCLVVTRELSLDDFPPHYQPAVIDQLSDEQFTQELGRWLEGGARRPHPLRVLIASNGQSYSEALAGKIAGRVPDADIVCATSAAQALQAAVTDKPFDVVITDYNMGEHSLSGFDLIRKLQSDPTYSTDFHPVVLHPYTGDHTFAGQVRMLGADWFIPERTDMLMNRLQSLARQLRQEAELV